jgi:hypothetical protein
LYRARLSREDDDALKTLALGVLVGAAMAMAFACGPSKPPMTPDSETEQQLPDLDAGPLATPPASASAPPPAK